MKLWQCDWVPSSVADWLCRELDERGIPGTTYTHTLLSLLHPYFCPHPVPREPSHHLKGFINFECISSILNSGQPQELEVLFEELEDHVHPDADFPELNISEPLKEGTRRSKKRQKRKLQQLSLSPEKIWKVAALQCLLTASDEHQILESVIEELFLRLKNTSKSSLEKEVNYIDKLIEDPKQEVKRIDVSSAKSDVADSSNFPPLSTNKSNNTEAAKGTGSTLNWKSLIKNKLSPEKQQYCSTFEIKLVEPSIQLNQASDHSIGDLKNVEDTFESLNISESKQKEREKLEMEISPNSLEDGALENKSYCFIPILRDEAAQFTSESNQGEIGTASIENGKGIFQVVDPVINKKITDLKEREKLEEWECTGDLLAGPVNRAVSVDILGNRLYERSVGSADITRCNSNTDLATFQTHSDDLKMNEATPSTPVASVWGYSSASWKESCTDSVWNPSAYILQPYNDDPPADQLKSVLPLTGQGNEDKFPNHTKEFENIRSKNQFIENWPPNQNWNSLALIDSKSDPIFSSAFRCSPHTDYKEGTRQDCKISIPEMSHKNLKNIWSDFNDNNITSVENRPDTVKNDAIKNSPNDLINFDEINVTKKTEEKLCESFRQLGLEQLWENPLLIENLAKESLMTKSFGSESVTFFDDPPKSQREQDLTSEEAYRMKCAENKEIEEDFLVHKIPSGPSGPYIDLRHTESSGFSAVIPHDKNLHVAPENSGEDDDDDAKSVTPKGTTESSLDHNLTAQEEENLLTSPRTHFRPIRQDSHGSIDETKSEDGQTILNMATNIQDPDLVFRRSGSGTLYLESDLLKGSPKKYMAYREPTVNVVGAVNPSDARGSSVFSQPDESPSTVFVPKFKLLNNEKFCQTEGPEGSTSLGESIGKELESKILQNEIRKYDLMYRASDQMWKEQYPKLIWKEQPKTGSKEAWELELNGPALLYPKWSTHDLNQADWANNPLQPSMQDSLNKNTVFKQPEEPGQLSKSEKEAFSKIKFIWHNSKGKSDTLLTDASAPSSLNIGTEFPSSKTSFSDSWDDQKPQEIGLQSDLPPLGSSLIVPKSPWDVGIGLQKEEADFMGRKQEEPLDLASRWQLQWEVDQEADEILGGLLPHSPLKASPPYENPLKKARSYADAEEFEFLGFLEGQDQEQQQQQHPLEDLDHLEPGWDLNEGFEWGPATEELFDCDDDDGGQEVLVYENEDGQTVILPVEYFEDSLYDQIFGSADTPIGGSLPDLPGGQMVEMKKGSLSYKLSRRSRGDKFVPPSRRPCSFFLEGNCRRSDCKFSHDLLTITCRFWEEGSCLKGDTCPFRHGFAPSRRRNRSEGDQTSFVEPLSFASLKEGNSVLGGKGKPIPKKNKGSIASVSSFELDSETDFPCLGSSVESKIGSLDEQNFPANVKVTRVSKKKKKYITVTKSLFKEMESENEKGGNLKSGGRKSKGGGRSTFNDPLLLVEGREDAGASSKKKGKDISKEKERSECESLRKVLRKRYPIPPQPPFSHEDGTLSDF